MRPLIGVPTDPFKHEFADIALPDMDEPRLSYFWLLARLTEKICSSIRNAGGVPMLLSAADRGCEIEALASRLDGFVFAGGSDIDPSFYGEPNRGSISPDLERDTFEESLLIEALKADKPVLGICRGCQLINVALGGTLYQNMPDVKAEWTLHKRSDVVKGYVHDIDILKPELFPKLDGPVMHVNSMHHQAIDRTSDYLAVIARTSDGLTEGVCGEGHRFLLGVQWHPECLAESDPVQAEIFERLVEASR